MLQTQENAGTPHRIWGKRPQNLILIGLALLVGLGLICWARTLDFGGVILFLYFVLPSLVPLPFVKLVHGILLALVLRGFWQRWVELVLLLTLWLGQTIVLVAWTFGITASDAFWDQIVRGGWNPYGLVLDSYFYEAFMTVFRYAASGILAVVVLASLVRLGAVLVRRRKPKPGTAWRFLALVVAVLVLVRMFADTREFHRMGASLADSTSPDGRFQVRLVPINAFADVNGVMMFRQAGSSWWYPMGRVGDELTTDRDDLSLVWDSNTQVRLLAGDRRSTTYDLTCGCDVSRLLDRRFPRATQPVTKPAPGTR
jgi:hypothetical protein